MIYIYLGFITEVLSDLVKRVSGLSSIIILRFGPCRAKVYLGFILIVSQVNLSQFFKS